MTVEQLLRDNDESLLDSLIEHRIELGDIVEFVQDNRRASAVAAARKLRRNMLDTEAELHRRISEWEDSMVIDDRSGMVNGEVLLQALRTLNLHTGDNDFVIETEEAASFCRDLAIECENLAMAFRSIVPA